MQGPCRYPKGDPRYIDPNALRDPNDIIVDRIIKYRDTCSREEQNDIERRRNEITLKSIKLSVQGGIFAVQGGIVAASIGAVALIFVTIYDSGFSKNIIKKLTNLENTITVMGSDMGFIGRSIQQDGTLCKSNQSVLRDIHRKHYPENYPDAFGNYRCSEDKSGE